ncbi:hypothetical protein CKA32_000138 [Geitlerinema sp. FC II]|nr:hypothetical protein CKA32_000138 [Geitlerinema sp. FC II]
MGTNQQVSKSKRVIIKKSVKRTTITNARRDRGQLYRSPASGISRAEERLLSVSQTIGSGVGSIDRTQQLYRLCNSWQGRKSIDR